MISLLCLPFFKFLVPTRLLDCRLGLGSLWWLIPRPFSANPALQVGLMCLGRWQPETLHMFLEMGQGSHLIVRSAERGYRLSACSA
jgi:hypothetical protein